MAGTENIRVRFSPDLANKWRATLDARKLTQQAAITALVAWVVEQDSLLQTMLFQQVDEADRADLAKIVNRRLAAGGKAKGKK